jgi:hypothetical protein
MPFGVCVYGRSSAPTEPASSGNGSGGAACPRFPDREGVPIAEPGERDWTKAAPALGSASLLPPFPTIGLLLRKCIHDKLITNLVLENRVSPCGKGDVFTALVLVDGWVRNGR